MINLEKGKAKLEENQKALKKMQTDLLHEIEAENWDKAEAIFVSATSIQVQSDKVQAFITQEEARLAQMDATERALFE